MIVLSRNVSIPDSELEITAIRAAAIVRTLAGDDQKQREVGLGFLPDQRVHTTPYQKEKL